MDLAEHFRRNVHKAPKAMRMLGHSVYRASESSQTSTARSTTTTGHPSDSCSTSAPRSKASSPTS